MSDEKTCTRCNKLKPLGDFKSDSRKPDGKASSCKACNTAVGYVAYAGSGPLADLSLYDQARALLAQAKAVDEVKAVLDKSIALKEYAKRANDRTGEIDCAEIRFQAERRMGEMILAQKQHVGLNAGSRGQLKGRDASGAPKKAEPDASPKLADLGITHKMSSHAQKLAAMPVKQFEALVDSWRAEISTGQARVTVDLLLVNAEERQRTARRELAKALSDQSAALPDGRRFPAGYFDFPVKRKQGMSDRSYENHYPTMTWDDIIAWCLMCRDRFLDDAWFFIWMPRAHLLALHRIVHETIDVDTGAPVKVEIRTPLIWAIADALGATDYSTCFVWTKTDEQHPNDIGTGLLVRDQDEILVMFKKGRGMPKPSSTEVEGSNHRERSKPLGHSRKPQHYRDMIARMVGHGVPVLECFARHDAQFPLPEAWEAWGNQAQPQ